MATVNGYSGRIDYQTGGTVALSTASQLANDIEEVADYMNHWDAVRIAKGLHDMGYRKPETITTAEELDALPVGSVVLSNGRAFQREYKAGGRNALDWSAHSMAFGVTNEWLLAHRPLTVLHRGDQ